MSGKILLTGATGYIGKRLLPLLVRRGYHVVCCVRDKNRFHPPEVLRSSITVIEVDLLLADTLRAIPADIDGAYYLVHSMSAPGDYQIMERLSAVNFRHAMERTSVRHVVYLTGIVNSENLSKHLRSRKKVEDELAKGRYNFTSIRSGIIIGSGSASFEIIRDLVEKLPVMITPKWLNTRCQPIGIRDVLAFLSKAMLVPETYNDNFDIGGSDVLTYRKMLLGYAKARNLKRWIVTLPVMTPKLSSYWLYFITSTTFRLAIALVDSVSVEVVCRDDRLNHILDIYPSSYEVAIQRAFARIENNEIVSSWKDSYVSSGLKGSVSDFINVPTYGCFVDRREEKYSDKEKTVAQIWRIGGDNGWYHASWLWQIRGFMDRMVGGVGLRRGRTHEDRIYVGDALDFWRVLYADKEEGRLLLYAEMKLPGEAWLEFRIKNDKLVQTATFRPKGLFGRLYWYAVLPFHGIVFNGMIKRLASIT